MPAGESKTRSYRGCWSNTSLLERILFCVSSVTIVIIIVLLLLLFAANKPHQLVGLPSGTCNTVTCLGEAAKIAQQIDSSVNPCEDFYQFACGTFIKNSHGDEKFNMQYKRKEQRKRELLEMYAEDERDDEHKMVKFEKRLFKKCMSQTEKEMASLQSVRIALKEAGGWPVLESRNWDERKFDWFRATYKLRQLGYPYSIFMDLQIQSDAENKEKYIFKVSSADPSNNRKLEYVNATENIVCIRDPSRLECAKSPNSVSYEQDEYKSEYLEKMTEVAIMFETPEFRDEIYREMNATYTFWRKLTRLRRQMSDTNTRYTVDEFQQIYGRSFDWLRFINLIAGSSAAITKDDYVLFQSQEYLKKWLDFISKTSKRTLANYMAWKVVEEQLPYLTKNLQNLATNQQEQETRAEFCLREISERFTQSPVEVMWTRKHLPVEKKTSVEQAIEDVKSEIVAMLENEDWMNQAETEEVVNKVKNITVLIGQATSYLDNEVLDELDVDMKMKIDSFLSFLAQATRNQQTSIYNRIKNSTTKFVHDKWLVKYQPIYDKEDNYLFIPTIALVDFNFNDKRPTYINYARLKLLLTTFFEQFDWPNQIKEAITNQTRCMDDGMKNSKSSRIQIAATTGQILVDKILYALYEKWIKSNGEENKLIGSDYTPRQLFWISTAICQISNPYTMLTDTLTENVARYSPNFAKDFLCRVESKTHHCRVF